jgi:hypothetical protein
MDPLPGDREPDEGAGFMGGTPADLLPLNLLLRKACLFSFTMQRNYFLFLPTRRFAG